MCAEVSSTSKITGIVISLTKTAPDIYQYKIQQSHAYVSLNISYEEFVQSN